MTTSLSAVKLLMNLGGKEIDDTDDKTDKKDKKSSQSSKNNKTSKNNKNNDRNKNNKSDSKNDIVGDGNIDNDHSDDIIDYDDDNVEVTRRRLSSAHSDSGSVILEDLDEEIKRRNTIVSIHEMQEMQVLQEMQELQEIQEMKEKQEMQGDRWEESGGERKESDDVREETVIDFKQNYTLDSVKNNNSENKVRNELHEIHENNENNGNDENPAKSVKLVYLTKHGLVYSEGFTWELEDSFSSKISACGMHLGACEGSVARLKGLIERDTVNLSLVVHEPEIWRR